MSATRMMMNASRLFASGVALKMPRLCMRSEPNPTVGWNSKKKIIP